MSYILGYDSGTLRETVDPAACRERLDEIGSQRSLPALLERVWLLKVLDRPQEAISLSDESVRVARMAGTRQDLLRARILHASVLQRLGAYPAADAELTTCVEEAEGRGWASIAAFAYQHRGKGRYEAYEVEGARADLRQALFLRQEAGANDAELAPALLAVDAADRRSTSLVAG